MKKLDFRPWHRDEGILTINIDIFVICGAIAVVLVELWRLL